MAKRFQVQGLMFRLWEFRVSRSAFRAGLRFKGSETKGLGFLGFRVQKMSVRA